MSVDGLTPAWVSTVPAPLRSQAEVIERYRITVVGDSHVLRQRATLWRTQADAADTTWSTADRIRATIKKIWQSPSASAFDQKAEVLNGDLTAIATHLRFAADGLILAADAIDRTRRDADASCIQYAAKLQQLYLAVLATAPPEQADAMARFHSESAELGRSTVQAVHNQSELLNTFLESMPCRFQVATA